MFGLGDKGTSIVEITKSGNLYFLLNSMIGAYNRRTDVMERAVKLDERIRAVTHDLNEAGNDLKSTVEKNQPRQ